MSELKPLGSSSGVIYEAPKVTEQSLNSGGNYVSPASSVATGTNKLLKSGTLGTSIIE